MNLQNRSSRRGGLFLHSLAAALLVTLASVAPAAAQLPQPTPTATPDPELNVGPAAGSELYVPGELVVGVRQAPGRGVSAASGMAVAAAVGAQVIETFDLTGPNDDLVTHLLQVAPGTEYEVAAKLASEATVAYVEPNWIVWAADEMPTTPPAGSADGAGAASVLVDAGFAVSDPFYLSRQWNMQRVNAARAWQMATNSELFTTTREVVVAVVDSGLDVSHPDFKGRVLPGRNYVTEDIDGDGVPELDPANVTDRCGHGTHVAGIAAAGLNDAVGVAGVAPRIKIEPRRVLGAGCSGSITDVAQAIEDAALEGADVINMSLVLGFDSPTIQAAIQTAAAQGALLVGAAGNNYAGSVYFPAKYPEVIAVAALGIDDRRTAYSNYGPEIEIAAPGGDAVHPVFSTWSKDAYTIYAGDPNNPNDDVRSYKCANRQFSGGGEYCTRYGTSQATPAVAGAAALLMSLNPALGASEVRSILDGTAAPLAEEPQFVGAGRLDVLAAVRTQMPASLLVTPPAATVALLNTDDPLTMTLRVDNPSLDPLAWEATLQAPQIAAEGGSLTPTTWITLTSGIDNAQTSTVSYGSPDFLTLVVSPTVHMAGLYEASVALTATVSGERVHQRVDLLFQVKSDPNSGLSLRDVYLPMILADGVQSANLPYSWLAPALPGDRISIPLTDTSSALLDGLPLTLALGNQTVNQLRIYSDGFVAVGDSAAEPLPEGSQTSNRCVPFSGAPADAVYGWWADLDPGAPGAKVSAFRLGSDRYVVEFADVPARNVAQPYTVSFQIVLHQSGNVQLNFRKVPEFDGAPEKYTVGVKTSDALFYSMVGCSTAGSIVGEQPSAGQSLLIRTTDIF